MFYTNIPNVAGMFPAFQRGTPQQKPSDALIQTFIDDVTGSIDAILARRFGEVIADAYAGNFATFQAALSADAIALLEKISRYGAAAQLGAALATLGAVSAGRLAEEFQSGFENLLEDLGADAGMYDHLFDSQAATPSPRPGLRGIAGGDQPKGQTPADNGMSNFFGKFDVR